MGSSIFSAQLLQKDRHRASVSAGTGLRVGPYNRANFSDSMCTSRSHGTGPGKVLAAQPHEQRVGMVLRLMKVTRSAPASGKNSGEGRG